MPPRERDEALEEQVLGTRTEASPLTRDREPAARAQHPVCLFEGRGRIGQVGKGLAHGHQVESRGSKHEMLGGHAAVLRCVGVGDQSL